MKEIAAKDIEKELASIWNELEGKGTMRACLHNLIIYSSECDRLPYLQEIVQKTIDKFPSRMIFVTLGGENLSTKVSVARSGTIACDLIDFVLPQKDHKLIPFMVMPHLICDLPTYVLWANDPTQKDPIASQLQKLATRIIYDSESCDDLNRFAKTALSDPEKPVADLNWARIEGWRVVLSNLYRSPDRLRALNETEKIHITYNSHTTPYFSHTRIQALYFQAWIASCLGWKLKSLRTEERGKTLVYDNCEITLEPVDFKQLAPGRIVTIEISAKDGDHLLLQRSPEAPQQIIIQHSTKELCSLPTYFMFAKYESGQSLVNEICHQGTSKHFFQTLELLAHTQEGLPC